MLNPPLLPAVQEFSRLRLALLEGRFDLDNFILRRLRGGIDVKITLTTEEILCGVLGNDANVNPDDEDPVVTRAESFGIDIDELEKITLDRAMHMVGKMDLPPAAKMFFTPMLGAMWLDGFFGALSALEAKPEDCP
jgi:hypothetical protein